MYVCMHIGCKYCVLMYLCIYVHMYVDISVCVCIIVTHVSVNASY